MNVNAYRHQLIKVFHNLTEDYRSRNTRLDARILFKMDLDNIAPNINDELVSDLFNVSRDFIRDYVKVKNYFKKSQIRHQHLRQYIRVVNHYSEQSKMLSLNDQDAIQETAHNPGKKERSHNNQAITL